MKDLTILKKTDISFKTTAIMTAVSVVFAVVLPQIFHLIGDAVGIGTSLGEILLPMHFPIILLGLIAGPASGFVGGVVAPILSYFLSGMPSLIMLPFIVAETAVYGIVSGFIGKTKVPSVGKVLITQLAGRFVRSVAIILSIFVFANETIKLSVIWNSIIIGIPGILLQLCLLPLIMRAVDKRKKHE